jgi:hypothetical protein
MCIVFLLRKYSKDRPQEEAMAYRTMLTAIACLISAIAAPAAAQEAPTIIPFDLSPQHNAACWQER